jgi:carbon monoxide dehydrogenase subunit G
VARVSHDISIARTPDEVWALIGQFGGLDTWMQGVESCVVEGKHRSVGLAGGMVAEEDEVARDDAARRYSYTVDGSAMGITTWLATISVEADGDGSKATWALEMEPGDLAETIGGVYAGALAQVKAHLEG